MRTRPLSVSLLPALAFALCVLLMQPAARAQCGRTWSASPNGVYDAASGYSQVRVTAEWIPPGQGTPVLVVGGDFLAAGDQSANNIAYWDGSRWHGIGWGFNAPVRALAVLNGVLYAGGDFTASSGTTLHYFAYWTGSAWADVALGTDGPVYALAVNGSELVVGGNFQHVAGGLILASRVARYAPATQWSPYNSQTMAPVDRIAVLSGQPIIMTEESGSGSPPYDHSLYRWTGSQWLLVTRLTYPGGMGVSGGNLFFSALVDAHYWGADGACLHGNEQCLMRFDGTTLHLSVPYRAISSFTTWNGQLYALGYVNYFCGYDFGPPEGPWMATWNGSQWLDVSSLDPGLSGGVLGSANGILYVGGGFDHVANQTQATNIARLIGFQWQPLAIGLDGPVTTSQPGSLAIGGSFTHEGASSVPYMATWNGQVWITAGTFNGPITNISNYSSNPLTISSTVASGSFTTIGGAAFNHIAIHAPFGGNWTTMGAGIDAPALCTLMVGSGIHHNDLLVGGQFITAGGVTCNRIARWTGAAWAAIGAGMNGDVRALANFGGLIVAGGSFTTADGAPAAYIAGWNGTSWAPIGGGMNGAVRCLTLYNGQLLAGGDFTTAGGAPAAHLAAWNGTSWSPFSGGADGPVYCMIVSGADLIIGGSFAHVGAPSTSAANIATWNSASAYWSQLGGTDGTVQTLSLSSGTLLAGGSFTHAGGQYAPYVALAPTPGDPSITQQPSDAAACPGHDTGFTVSVDPGAWFVGVTYNWYHDGYLMNDGPTPWGSIYSQSHTASVTISNLSTPDAGGYWCTATTACGQSVSSNTVQLTVGGAGCCGSADFNCDGDLGTDADIAAFFACLAGNCPGAPCPNTADFNGDGDIGTDADIAAFFRVLAGGNC